MKDPASSLLFQARKTVRSRLFLAGTVVLTLMVAACGDDGPSSPTGPTPTPATTRIIALSGNLAFGDVPVGSSRDATLTIRNTGNAVLTITSLTAPGDLADLLTADWTSGQVAAGASQAVTIRFTPTQPGSYSGTLAVNGDQTSGTNTIAVSATATGGAFSGNWLGGHIITACDGTGSAQDLICSAARGEFPVGSNMLFAATLQQTGSSVSGTVNLAGLEGTMSGTVVGGVLSLQGTATGEGFTAVVTRWSTTVSGSTMSGAIDYDLRFVNVPGVASIRSTLSDVTRLTTTTRAGTMKPIRRRT
ncbi:MAG: choice-of-anchor D domain-containing protein [Vicinamibacterales bacterium]